jgi:glycosyltransferase involved in cell wall biosynthesis
MNKPAVTVICLCYNHSRFVSEAVFSVLNQTYSNIQLIVVDDASTDASAAIIKKLQTDHPSIETLFIESNVGSCKAFNKALQRAKGDYLIDLSADDVLLPHRVEEGVRVLTEAGPSFGAQFTDAEYIDEAGKHLSFHSDKFPHNTIPQGDIYKDFIERYFICPPTVMFTRALIDSLNGYDEELSYEDFDLYIRSSRNFGYIYTPAVLVKRRITIKALSGEQFKFFSRHSYSTYRVCKKIVMLNKNREEQRALSGRILYEMRLNMRLFNFILVIKYAVLWFKNNKMIYGR